ncbi:sugar ABC transporter substrate-binding protein [Acrocarpospora macrocephala]|uniref:Sugar ABC transporter substrate-binding protein n=1 Tax=Acrocarpospora macrocephala TaxID=150177 RepID=A0A5M3XCC5_9ACTN|nr:extracellular solute-binding protein [Acrocarpospora macrocephala]GES16523.1 sugar ABC transporter substrate-binding protein [Acrocarpospora macrocephala]
MQHRWRILTATSAAAGLLLLSACGEDAPAPATGGEVTGAIDVWMGDPIGATQQPVVIQLAKDYETAHPGTKVNLRFLGADAHKTYLTSIAGGTVPCVALIGNTWSPEFAGLKALEPIAQDPASMQGTYTQSMIDSTVLDGVSYAVPYDTGVRALIYRKDLFDAAGLAAPKTWDEVLTAATTVQKANEGVNGFGIVGGNQWYWLPMIWNWGGEIATNSGGAWTAKVNSPEAIAAFTFYAELLTKHKLAPEGSVTWQGADAAKAFALGQVGMMVGGSWDLKTIIAQNPGMEAQLATAPMPSGPGGNNDTFAGGSNLAIFKGCTNKATAKSFVDFMMRTDNLVPVTTKIGLLPATTDALEKERTTGSFSAPLLKAYAEQAPNTRSIPAVSTWGKVEGTGAIVNAMQSIMNGQKTAEAAMQELAGQIDAAIGQQ